MKGLASGKPSADSIPSWHHLGIQERRDKKLKYLRRIGIRPTKEGKIKDFGKRDS
jgi:hypothetical protein